MIFGSFSPVAKPVPTTTADWMRNHYAGEDFVFREITAGGFRGGFILNSRLPYVDGECYFSDEAADITVLLYGNIYNMAELFPGSGALPGSYQPELIAKLFLSEGEQFAGRLNGDFVIYIMQPRKKTTLLYRDHLGIRPVAFTDCDGFLTFSTDIIALCNSLADGRPVDSEYLMAYFKYIDYKRTPDSRVRKLLPGHYIRYSADGMKVVRYWDPGRIRTDRRLDYECMLSDLAEMVHDAVRIRCDRRFTAGAHITGGLDSGTVSVLARKGYDFQKEFHGFSWSPEQFRPEHVKYDERELILSFCRHADILPHFSEMKGEDFHRIICNYYFNQGYFSEDQNSDQIAGMSVNLIFSGWGGDEFISTGDRGIETDLLTGFRLKTFFRRNPIRWRRKFFRYLFMYVIYPALGMLDSPTAKMFRDDSWYLRKPFRRSNRKAIRYFYSHFSRRQMHLRLLKFYHIQERCESWAVNGFRKGVEYRYPLLDRRIVEYMIKVPSELLCRTNYFRPLLRIIGKEILPEQVRVQNDKSDPVCWDYIDKLFVEASGQYMDEASDWKKNSDLHFVNFNLLLDDIMKYKNDPSTVDVPVLVRALVYLKAIHEFTGQYHGRIGSY